MQARVTRTMASVGLPMLASGTFSIRTSPALYITVARMVLFLESVGGWAGAVFGVGHLFHQVDDLSVECFLDGDVRHCRRRRRAVPMTMVGRAPQDVARVDLDDRPAFALRPALAGRDDQRLPKG